MRSLSMKLFTTITVGTLAFATVACSTDDSEDATSTSSSAASTSGSASQDSGQWPRTITHELGETVIEAQPERIANTALSATGTLLAINAPVIASAATNPSDITDDKGFFSQWADVADEKGVEVLYPGLQFDMESLIVQDPDVVIVSISGADSVSDQYDQISAQFPTIAIDYSKQSWQELATELGAALGLEDDAQAAIDEFDDYIADAAGKITAPEGGATIVSFNGPGQTQGIAKKGGPHADLMEELGVEIHESDPSLDTSERVRDDFAFVSFENLSQAITGGSVFLLTGTEETAASFLAEPTVANLDAVKNDAVYPLGPTSFRIDPYSGRQFADAVVVALGA